jgi:hypothetical protein
MIRKFMVAIFLVLLLAPMANAVVVEGVTLPDKVMVAGDQLVLNGAGVRVKKILVVPLDVYVIGLYVKEKTSDAQAIIMADETMMLKIQILTGLVTAEKFKHATLEGFEESTGGNMAPIQKEIDLFLTAFSEEINKGDVFEIQYVKGKGTYVYKNGKSEPEVLVPGLNVKQALFGIWLGHRTEKYLQVLAKDLLGK